MAQEFPHAAGAGIKIEKYIYIYIYSAPFLGQGTEFLISLHSAFFFLSSFLDQFAQEKYSPVSLSASIVN